MEMDGLVVALQLPVGLWVVRRRPDVTDPHQVQVVTKSPGDVARPIVAQQSGAVFQGHFGHPRSVNGQLDHLDQGISRHVHLQLPG